MPGPPDKANPPLLVNSYGVLSLAVSAQRLQLISGRRRQNAQFRCGMQLQEFPQRDSLEGTESPGVLIVKEFFGFRARETLNHTPSIPRDTLYANSISCE